QSSGGATLITLSIEDTDVSGFVSLEIAMNPPAEGDYPVVGTPENAQFEIALNIPSLAELPEEDIGLGRMQAGSVTLETVSEKRIRGRYSASGALTQSGIPIS